MKLFESKTSKLTLLIACIVAVLLFAFIWSSDPGNESNDPQVANNVPAVDDEKGDDAKEDDTIEQELSSDPGSIQVGGVRRPVTDLPSAETNVADQNGVAATADEEMQREYARQEYYGKNTPVAFDTNAQTKKLSQALLERRNPEQFSSLLPPKAFDLAVFKADPQAYVDTIEPGRAFQVLQPGPDVQSIGKISPHYQSLKQGESVYLQVSAPEGMPTTFTSLDLGRFENELTSITVLANSEGVAQASFTGSSGTIEDVHIVVGSPVMSGTAKFIVHVTK